MKPPTILVTGFGPFPGAHFNPTGALARRLARLRRPGLGDVRLTAHVFATSYRAVDRDLPRLLSAIRPDVLLMFGLAARSRGLRIEIQARNAVPALTRDADGQLSFATCIAPGARSVLRLNMPAQRLMLACRQARIPAKLSRDAGRYLCNYLSWRAAEAAAKPGGPKLAAFVHVPPPRRQPMRRRASASKNLTMTEMVRGGEAILRTLATVARARRLT